MNYLQILMTICVTVNTLDITELFYCINIPKIYNWHLDTIIRDVKLPISEIKSEIWEDILRAMSDTYTRMEDGTQRKIIEADSNIQSATVEVKIESLCHKGEFRKELLPDNSSFEGWSVKLHNIIEAANDELSDDIVGMLIAIAEAYHSQSEGGGDPRYGICRHHLSNQRLP